jgi:hypothetical protein
MNRLSFHLRHASPPHPPRTQCKDFRLDCFLPDASRLLYSRHDNFPMPGDTSPSKSSMRRLGCSLLRSPSFLLLSPSFAAADIKGNFVLFQKGEIMRSMPCRCEGNQLLPLARSASSARVVYSYIKDRMCARTPLVPACLLTDDQLALLGEVVLGDLKVEGGRAFPDAAGDVVVGAVAGAEPTAVVAGLADGDTTQVGADACCGRVSGWLHARVGA